jgi:hypothetical protein
MDGGRWQRTYRKITVAHSLGQDGGSDLGDGAVGTTTREARRVAVGAADDGRNVIGEEGF